MLRSCLICLLLCNYLLVVGAGMVNRPERPRYSAAHPYAHSATCQQQNYLRLDCFGTCNGDQHALDKSTKPLTPQQVLTVIKGIDVHYLIATVIFIQPIFRCPAAYAAELEPRVPAGFAGLVYSPPRRG
jgi:hypothetical protein